MRAPDRSSGERVVFRTEAEIHEAAYWAVRVALRRELRETPAKPLLGEPRAVPMSWQFPPPAAPALPVLQAAE